MPVLHTVAFKLVAATATQITAAQTSLAALSEIPGCRWVRFGETFTTERARGYTHQLVAEFESREALQIYATHPAHLAFITTHLKPLFDLSSTLALDIDF
ncbi:hypothetical protein HK100_000550 [Physocladia obscura]|uniref:Stress-response A/B barrel domain-containing protein n=1 Tax=Physocladia obscura TaxID=109957 RepID=A0AAD5T7W0_9FUNG|nr:hypothetical protein HK100_000550 [Physocladia obscura]